MDENSVKSKKNSKKISITTLLGIFLILIALVGFLSASPGISKNSYFKFITYIFSYPIFYIMGFVGYWVLYPGLLIYGLIILFRNRLIPIQINASFFGYILFVLFVCIGFSQIVTNNTLNFTNFFEQFNASFSSNDLLFMFNVNLAGGFVGFFFAGLFNSIGSWLLWLIIGVGLFLSIILIFHIQLRNLRYKIRDHRKSKKNKKLNKNQENDDTDTKLISEEVSLNNKIYEKDDSTLQDEFDTKQIQLTRNNDLLDSENKEPTIEMNENLSHDEIEEENNFNFQIKSFNKSHGLKKAVFYYGDDPHKPSDNDPIIFSNNINRPSKDENVENNEYQVDDQHEIIENNENKNDDNIEQTNNGEIEDTIAMKPAIDNITPVIKETVNIKKGMIHENKNKSLLPPEPVKSHKKFILPPLSLLDNHDNADSNAKNIKYCEEIKIKMNDILKTFNINASIVGYTVGPSVTRYDLLCQDDTSISTITKYIRDISIRLGGIPMRFEELVVGSSTSGLEIANKTSSMVGIKECIEALPDLNKKTSMHICFGKDISSNYKICSMRKFPHLLVAGTTGSGKSVFIHTMIVTLIMRNTPEELRLVLIDPKRVELAKYRDIPHLLCPIIVEPGNAKVALKKLCDEMNRRYSLFENAFVSDIEQYNDLIEIQNGTKLATIVCVIDEYADLKENCKEIDTYVALLGGKARASGIHLIVATQRPTTDVISGTIKANLLSRVALSVSSGLDSRVIIDQNGAEELLGNGDMLVSCTPMARGYLVRCQGSYASNSEIFKVCDFLKKECPVDYDENFLDLEEHFPEKDNVDLFNMDSGIKPTKDQDSDDFYYTILSNIVLRDYASMSAIQRDFSVGFNRAGKIMIRLTNEGVVSQEKEANRGSKVLIHSMEEYYAIMESKEKIIKE